MAIGDQRIGRIPDYYGMLGVPPHASDQELDDAHLRIRKERGSDFIDEADEAFEVLSDPQERQEYDTALRREVARLARMQEILNRFVWTLIVVFGLAIVLAATYGLMQITGPWAWVVFPTVSAGAFVAGRTMLGRVSINLAKNGNEGETLSWN